jgi:hypothetical protein
VGVIEDTMMSEKEERDRVGRHREANRASAASAARTHPIGPKARGQSTRRREAIFSRPAFWI